MIPHRIYYVDFMEAWLLDFREVVLLMLGVVG